MNFHVLTLFPEMIGTINTSITKGQLKRASYLSMLLISEIFQ